MLIKSIMSGRPQPIRTSGPAHGGTQPPEYVVTPPVRPRRRSERKARRSRKITRRRKNRMVGGGNCPQGGNHNCVATGAQASNVLYRCSKCKQTC